MVKIKKEFFGKLQSVTDIPATGRVATGMVRYFCSGRWFNVSSRFRSCTSSRNA